MEEIGNMLVFTDYPFKKGEERQIVPLRVVEFISYDGDKYAIVRFENLLYDIKIGYLFVPLTTHLRSISDGTV